MQEPRTSHPGNQRQVFIVILILFQVDITGRRRRRWRRVVRLFLLAVGREEIDLGWEPDGWGVCASFGATFSAWNLRALHQRQRLLCDLHCLTGLLVRLVGLLVRRVRCRLRFVSRALGLLHFGQHVVEQLGR